MTTTEQTEPRMVTFKMSEADHAELVMLAQTRDRSVSAELRLAVKAWLAEAQRMAS
jgi:hypothetical protein